MLHLLAALILVLAQLAVALPAAAAVPAAHDFDGDGRAELLLADPVSLVRRKGMAGAVSVLYGSANGVGARDQRWHRDARGIKGPALGTPNDDKYCCQSGFGQALTSGDFAGDGFGDVVATHSGNPRTRKYQKAPPSFTVLYGSAAGASRHDDLWSLDSRGIKGRSRRSFGFEAPVTGDFDGDGYDDLLFNEGNGRLHAMAGSPGGLAARDVRLSRQTRGVVGSGDFGYLYAAAVGDFNADGRDDAAVPAVIKPGVFEFTLFCGGAGMLRPRRSQRWTAERAAAGGSIRMFGSVLAAGDVGGDAADDPGDRRSGAGGRGLAVLGPRGRGYGAGHRSGWLAGDVAGERRHGGHPPPPGALRD